MTIKRRFRWVRPRALVCLAALVCCLGAGPLVAGASEHGSGHRPAHGRDHGSDQLDGIVVTWTRSPKPGAAPPTPGTPVCLPDKQCIATFSGGKALLAGDLTGEALNGSAFAPFLPGKVGGGVAIFIYTLSASPCGAGTVIFMSMNSNSADPNGPASGLWQIVAGAGTGDLVHMSGSGTTSLSPDLTSATYEGDIFCS